MNQETLQKLLLRAADLIDALTPDQGRHWREDGLIQELRQAAQEVGNDAPAARYKIVRYFYNGSKRVIKRNLPLSLAQEHCQDPETSSSTCTKAENKRRTYRCGPWFDGYVQQ